MQIHLGYVIKFFLALAVTVMTLLVVMKLSGGTNAPLFLVTIHDIFVAGFLLLFFFACKYNGWEHRRIHFKFGRGVLIFFALIAVTGVWRFLYHPWFG